MTTPQTPPTNPPRRHLLTAGMAVAAAAAGMAGSWWTSKNNTDNTDSTAKSKLAGDLSQLWTQAFDTPSGDKLNMQALRGKPLLINFWATWCPPCVDELPLLARFYTENTAKSAQMIGLAADKPEAVRAFLQKMPLPFPVGMVGLTGIAMSKSWGNLSGGLPFSVMLAADGHVMQRKMGKLSAEDLTTWVSAF